MQTRHRLPIRHRLEVTTLAIEAIRKIRPLADAIDRQNRDLAKQLRRAASSIALNLAEAEGSDAGNQRARLHTALGSARETRIALEVAAALGHIPSLEEDREIAALDDLLDRIAATIFRILRR